MQPLSQIYDLLSDLTGKTGDVPARKKKKSHKTGNISHQRDKRLNVLSFEKQKTNRLFFERDRFFQTFFSPSDSFNFQRACELRRVKEAKLAWVQLSKEARGAGGKCGI